MVADGVRRGPPGLVSAVLEEGDDVELRAALRLASELLGKHGLEEWSVGLDRAKRRAGACHHAPRVISLSRPLTQLHDEVEVHETILHEIAHALVGPKHGHDETWRRAALAIGSTGRRCVSDEAPKLAGKFIGRCVAGHECSAHKRPERIKVCSSCSGPEWERLISWTWQDVEVRMHPRYVAALVGVAKRYGGQAQEQLDLDEMLGGGAERAIVAALQGPQLRPGTRVRLVGDPRIEGLHGSVRSFGRTYYKVVTDDGQGLRVPPHMLKPC